MRTYEKNDDIPDKTLSELKESGEGEVDWGEAEEEFTKDREEFLRLAELMFTAALLGEMFSNDIITLREYFALMEYVEEQERELDSTLM